jgi:hypothetical protein
VNSNWQPQVKIMITIFGDLRRVLAKILALYGKTIIVAKNSAVK